MSWTLTKVGGESKSFEDWGFANVRKVTSNQGQDEVTFAAPGVAADSDPVFVYNDVIEIAKDGVRWFKGRIVDVPAQGEGGTEGISYRAVGVWFDLDELVFQILWGAEYSSHVILNLNPDRSFASVKSVIEAVIEFAADNGIDIQAGEILTEDDEEVFPPADEVTDRTCGQIIRDQLRWLPRSIAWIDYATDPPTFHCRLAQHLEKKTLGPPPTDESERAWLNAIQGIGIRKRMDLVRPAVVFKYEIKSSVNGLEMLSFDSDIWPEDATGLERGALMQTFSILGPALTTVSAEIETETIDLTDVDWWKAHFPELARNDNGLAISNLTIANQARSGALSLPRMLSGDSPGNLAPWMKNGSDPVRWEDEVISARVSYNLLDSSDPNVGRIEFVENKDVSLQVRATDAETGVYTTTATAEEADPIWKGLARFIYEQLATPQFEGQIKLVAQEIVVGEGAVGMGNVVNVAGLKTEWATMDGVVQRVEEFTETGEVIIAFGPPSHLAPTDLIELLQVGRGRRRWTNPSVIEDGELGTENTLELGSGTPVENGMTGNGSQRVLKVYQGTKVITFDAVTGLLKIAGADGKSMTIDLAASDWTSAPQAGRALIVKETAVCEKVNGVDTQRYALFVRGASYDK
jgi:hypothetical protein